MACRLGIIGEPMGILSTERDPVDLEAACRAWWDIKRPDGTRIATCSWDEWVEQSRVDPIKQKATDDYRHRMAAALAAVGVT